MRVSSTLIPVRFLTIIAHLCVLITLLWESQRNTILCLPKNCHNGTAYSPASLVSGLAASIALTLAEMLSFLCGLTMFSPSICMFSAFAHGTGTVCLAYWVLEDWLCDWFWIIFALCNVLPSSIDITAGIITLCCSKQALPCS